MPVKSRLVSNDWSRFCGLLERTLRSITNQTSNAYRVVVVCHEIPDIAFQHPKVQYLSVDYEPPMFESGNYKFKSDPGEDDKARKILAGLQFCDVMKSDYVMAVDSDDLISNRIVDFVEKNKSESKPGWYVKQGFMMHEGSRKLILIKKNFNERCGTCQIIRPTLVNDLIEKSPGYFLNHKRIVISENQVLKPLPIRAAIYNVGNGENLYASTRQIRNLSRKSVLSIKGISDIFKKLRKFQFHILTRKHKLEFGLLINSSS